MNQSIYEQTKAAIAELSEKANLREGSIVVVGCSTSEVLGAKIGTNSDPDTAGEIFRALYEYTQNKGFFLAIQCCEHLNRAIVTERKAIAFAEPVNVRSSGAANVKSDAAGTAFAMVNSTAAVPV